MIRVSGASSRCLVGRRLPPSLRRPWKPRHFVFDGLSGPRRESDRPGAGDVFRGTRLLHRGGRGGDFLPWKPRGRGRRSWMASWKPGARLAEPGEFTLRAFSQRKDWIWPQAEGGPRSDPKPEPRTRRASPGTSWTVSCPGHSARCRSAWCGSSPTWKRGWNSSKIPWNPTAGTICYGTCGGSAAASASWEESFRVGRVLRDGFVATIAGRPNAGKSSIFNALCRHEKGYRQLCPRNYQRRHRPDRGPGGHPDATGGYGWNPKSAKPGGAAGCPKIIGLRRSVGP